EMCLLRCEGDNALTDEGSSLRPFLDDLAINVEREGRTNAHLTLHANVARHHSHKFPADWQPQPCSLVCLASRCRLSKRLKQFFDLAGGNAGTGVLYLEFQLGQRGVAIQFILVRFAYAHSHFALVGKLERVTEKVNQDLAQFHFVAVQE